jgi:hypothetical protein
MVIAGAVVLALMAVGMRPAANATEAAIQKLPVPIRKPLRALDKHKLIGFRYVSLADRPATFELGTPEFIEWRFAPESPDIRATESAFLQIYYYTERGKTPLVPHTPEVCYRQQGDHILEMGSTTLSIPGWASDRSTIDAKFVRLTQTSQNTKQDICIVYVFCVNGRFYSDREWARLFMAMPWNRALYFCKFECLVAIPRHVDPQIALAAGRQMLSCAIAQVVDDHLPTDADIEQAQ